MTSAVSDTPPAEGILRRVARELTRVVALQVVGALLVQVAGFALARLLGERDFGVFAIGMFFLNVGSLLGDEGIAAALLLKREALTDEECEVAVTFLLALGGAMAVVFLAGSGLIARRYHLVGAEVTLLRAMTPLFLVVPLRAVPYLRLQRALRLADVARIEVLAGIVQQLTAIVLAWFTRDAWALVGAYYAGSATQLALAWRAAPGLSGLSIRWSLLRPLLSYGLKVQGLSIAAFLKDNVSAIYLGAAIGPQAVGVFDFGVRYAQLPVTAVNAMARAQLSVYSRFSADDPQLHMAVTAITRLSLLTGLALLVTMSVGATAIIPAVYHARWLASVPVVYGLVANMAGGLIAGPLFALLQAQGRAGLAVRLFVVWTASTWGLVLAVRAEGIGAVAWAHSTMTVITVFWLVRWAERHLGRPLLEGYTAACASAVGAIAGVWGLGLVPSLASTFKNRWLAAALSLLFYAALLVVLERGRVVKELTWLVKSATAKRATARAG